MEPFTAVDAASGTFKVYCPAAMQEAEGATISITDGNGTTTANVSKGAKGDKGDTGDTGPQGHSLK